MDCYYVIGIYYYYLDMELSSTSSLRMTPLSCFQFKYPTMHMMEFIKNVIRTPT